jgi:hypothetical protein
MNREPTDWRVGEIALGINVRYQMLELNRIAEVELQ